MENNGNSWLKEVKEMTVKDGMNYVGSAGPWLLFLNTLMMLRNDKQVYFWYYVIGWIANLLLNVLLKLFFREPRPGGAVGAAAHRIALFWGRVILEYNQYGMPSGHAQVCAFSLVFVAMMFKRLWITFIYFLLTFLSMMQRISMGHHTLWQVVVGAVIGGGIGYMAYRFAQRYKMGRIMGKKDDGAPAWTGFA